MKANKPDLREPLPISQALAISTSIGTQAGCAGVVLILGAVLLGRWLDGQLGSAPWVTLVLIVLSMPVSLLFMFRIVMRSVERLQAPDRSEENELDHDEIP